jgi:hypothetical protein
MKKILLLLMVSILLTSCSITIPVQADLNNDTMLLAKTKNIKANYTLLSDVSDGYLNYVAIQKNGTKRYHSKFAKYRSETAFRKIWSSYFSNKFSNYSKDEMNVKVKMKKLRLKQQTITSSASTLFSGNLKYTLTAVTKVYFEISYHGETYRKEFDVESSGYNENQKVKGAYNYTGSVNVTNPTQQKAELLEDCFNKSIIQFENYVTFILMKDKE